MVKLHKTLEIKTNNNKLLLGMGWFFEYVSKTIEHFTNTLKIPDERSSAFSSLPQLAKRRC